MASPPIDVLPTLYNTGVDDNHDLLSSCDPDLHYGNAVRDPTIWPLASGPWISNTSDAQWLSPNCDGDMPEGPYSYTLNFTVPADLGLLAISGELAVDNYLRTVTVNGALSDASATADDNLSHFTSFNLSGFYPGVNTIVFGTENAYTAGPEGLIVRWTGYATKDFISPGFWQPPCCG